MALVAVDACLAELSVLDVVDVLPDGTLRLNPDFVAACVAAYEREPGKLGEIVQDRILTRALARGYAGLIDIDALALAALELGAAEAESASS